jgi:predicted nucleic acid-binding protein
LTEAVYVDTSALVKLIAAEAETRELIPFLGVRPIRIASAIVIVELGRALGRRPDVDASRSFLVLDRLVLVDTDRRILERAAGLAPAELRSLDAIHLATAIEVRDSIDAVVTYDDRLAAAAQIHGFATAAPGRAG